MKTKTKSKNKPTSQPSKLRDLPSKKNPKGGLGGTHVGPSGPGG